MKKERKNESVKVRFDAVTKLKLLHAASSRGETLSKFLRRVVEITLDTER